MWVKRWAGHILLICARVALVEQGNTLEHKRGDVADRHHIWTAKRQPFLANHLERLTFIDDACVKTIMTKTTRWAPRGQRVVDHAPFGHWRSQSLAGALRHDQVDAPWVIYRAMNSEMFDLYFRAQLAPMLRRGGVLRQENDPPDHFLILLIRNHLSSHKSPAAAHTLHAIGACFLFLWSGKTRQWRLF
jgi:hypothetical protein